MKRTPIVLVFAFAAAALAVGCAPAPRRTDSVVVASAPFESLALVYVAQDRGMFADHGLDVTFREYDTGVAALDGVLAGEADVAVGTAEFPLVAKAFAGAPVSALAIIDRPDFIYLVGRKDRGVLVARDLRGKRVGTVARSAAQFYLGRFLELNGMSTGDIEFEDVRTPQEWRAGITTGDLDAVVLAQPEAAAVAELLGANATMISIQENQPAYSLVVAGTGWTDGDPDVARRFLAALADAEEFVASDRATTESIVREQLDLDPAYMEAMWAQNDFALSLDQSLVLAMEDEARWMIRKELTTATAIPDFGEYISADSLQAVKPESVSILR